MEKFLKNVVAYFLIKNEIPRENITGFEKNSKVNFFAINHKKSLDFSNRVDSALSMRPIGVLPYLLMKGVTSAINSAVNKNEEELIEKTGQKYTLKFLDSKCEINRCASL